MRTKVLMAFALAVSVTALPACASKKFVRTSVGEVNSKVDSVGKTVEETQSRTKANEERIGQVDQKAEAAAKSASSAGSAASAAAAAAKAADDKAAAAQKSVAAVEAASKRLILEVTLSEDQGNFDRAKADLPEAARSRIDQLMNQVKGDAKSVFIEIEGHTDNTGSSEFNDQLGLERAESVKRYIYEQHQIPLHRINVITYGENKPVAPNNTRDGRAQNRRVVVKVLS